MAYAMHIKHARPTSKHARFDGKAETEWSEPSMSIYLALYLSIYLFIYLCNIYVTIYRSIYSVHVEHVANRPSYTEQSDTRQTGRYIKHTKPTSKHARETAKLKLNGVNQVCQSIYVSICLSIYLSIYLSIFIYLCNIYVTIYLSILCTSNMLQTGQATPSSLTHVKQAGISNMPGRRQNMPGRRQS